MFGSVEFSLNLHVADLPIRIFQSSKPSVILRFAGDIFSKANQCAGNFSVDLPHFPKGIKHLLVCVDSFVVE